MGETEELLRDMLRNGHDLDATLSSCLIKSYCEDGDLRRAMQVLYDTLDKSYIISLDSFSILVKELCAQGKTVDAEKIFEDMCIRCTILDIDSYRRVLDAHLCFCGKRMEGT